MVGCAICGSEPTQDAHVRPRRRDLSTILDRNNNIVALCYGHHQDFDTLDPDGWLIGIDCAKACFLVMEDKRSVVKTVKFPPDLRPIDPSFAAIKNEGAHYRIRWALGLL